MATLKTKNEITEYLKSQNKPYDYTSRTSLYKQLGLEPKLGSYVSSGQQNTAMINLSTAQKNEAVRRALGLAEGETAQMGIKPTGEFAFTGFTNPTAKTPITYPSSQISTLPKTGDLGFPKSSAEYDQWIKMGRTFQNGKWIEAGTTVGTTAKPTLETISKGVQDVAGKTQALTQQFSQLPSVSIQPTPEYNTLDIKDDETIVDDTMKDIAEQIGTTDIATLIGQFSSGELTTPEMEITGEDRQAQLDKLKTDTAGALQKLQQNMAKRGMTFSGIRTQAEADLAAETLSVEAGINRDFASRIISAARQEQGRRETALQAAEQGYNKALEVSGYVYNPYTNKVEKSLAREKFETEQATPERPQIFGTAETGYYQQQYNPSTGQWENVPTGIIKPATTSKEEIDKAEKREKEFWTAIDKGKNELQQGETWGNVWNRVKLQFPDVPNEIIDDALGVSWREQGAYQEFKGQTTSQNLSKWEVEGSIWQWLTTDEANSLSDEEKKQAIMNVGLDPITFGIY